MEIVELLQQLKDLREKEEVQDEFIKIYNYKIYILENGSSSEEIENFIKNTIDKYRSKIEVFDYYPSADGDHLSPNSYDNLCLIENMIFNYTLRKVVLESKN